MEADAHNEENNRHSPSPEDTTERSEDSSSPTRSRPHCKVLLLDDEYLIVPVDKKAKGEDVINHVLRHLEVDDVQEKEYFSLYYVDSSDCKIFLNPYKQVRKQLPNATNNKIWELRFGVQFYATEIAMLSEDVARYLYVLQICRDVKDKRINPDHSTKLQLVALLVQANRGDYDPDQHQAGYTESFIDMIYNQAEIPVGLENSVCEVHKEKTGFAPSEADSAFFMIARGLYKFGQHVFPVKDRLGQSGNIGASIVGLFFHKDGREFMKIGWGDIVTLGYRRKKLRVKYHPKGADDEERIEMLYLRCREPNAKLVWRACVEQHTFFRLERPKPAVQNSTSSFYTFNRGSEFRFSRGKTLYQMMRNERNQQPKEFKRTLSLPRSLPARNSERNRTIINDDPEPIPLPDRFSDRNETLFIKEPSPVVDGPDKEQSPEPDESKEQSPEPESSRESSPVLGSRPGSVSLQEKIEEALQKRSQEEVEVIIEPVASPDPVIAVVEVEDDEPEPEDIAVEVEPEQPKDEEEYEVQIDSSFSEDDDDEMGAQVEFSKASKHNSSFMVTLEETYTEDDEPELNTIMLEGKYRSDSIMTTDLGPAAHYLLQKSDVQTGTITETEVDIELDDKLVENCETSTVSSDDSGFNHVELMNFGPQLLHVHGLRKNISIDSCPLNKSSLNSGDVFILDLGLIIYQWNGKFSNKDERFEALKHVQQLKSERSGKPNVEILSEADVSSTHEFYEKLSKQQPLNEPLDVENDDKFAPSLFRLSDESGSMALFLVNEGALIRSMLDPNDVFIADTGVEVFVWIGNGASKDEKTNILIYAHNYLMTTKHPLVPVTCIKQGEESAAFNTVFT